ncbi:hypothetical protein CDL12_09221 [Handroanthus impetiginosus]|uniref:Uncharacterized protein n=1 Tax=Handroanthus impetiginosus TaxID=429701 RepID=A0A2G9HKS1_9LAMI|nr:hypothetical protein CDL12_09221 [Handroanthus impetiginosus]
MLAREDVEEYDDESAFQDNQSFTLQEVPITIDLDQINILLDENSVEVEVDITEIQPVEMLAREDVEEYEDESDEENTQEDDDEDVFKDSNSDNDTDCED